MKVLFITAPYTFSDMANLKIKYEAGILPNLGILYIAAILEKKGHIVRILDLPVLNYSFMDIKKRIETFRPDILCFSSTTPTRDKVFRLIEKIDKFIDVPIIYGGPDATSFPIQILNEQKAIDIVAIGEGDYTVSEILDCLRNKKNLNLVKGIYYRDKNKIIKTTERPWIKNLDELPMPARHLIDIKRYKPLPIQYKNLPMVNMITSRGCPYHCTFCFDSGKLGHTYRRQSPEKVINEIKYLIKTYKIKEISFWDDNFIIDEKWIFDFCNLLEKEKIHITWFCFARVDRVTKKILKKIAKAGCWCIFYGLESGNQLLLNKIKKGTTIQQAINAIKWTREVGIEARGAFILGLPGETPKMGKKTIDFALSLNLDYAQFAYTMPHYGTKLYSQCLNEGKLLINNFSKFNNNEPVFLPRGYKNVNELKKMFNQAYKRFYFRPAFIIKHLKKIRNFTDIKKYISGFKLTLAYTFFQKE